MAHRRKSTLHSEPALTTPTAEELRTAPPADPSANVDEEDIRRLAYRKWEEAGRPEMDGQEFWLQAERELKHAFAD